MDDFKARNWINDKQHGFRPGEGSEEAMIIMLKLIHYILRNGKGHQKNKIKGLHVIFYDFEKAFDKAWSQGLIFKTRKSGIYGITFEQIKFLANNTNVSK